MQFFQEVKKILGEFQEESKLHMITGFAKCSCGWKSETVGGVIEHPSLQPKSLERMLSRVKDETRVQLIEHRDETNHDPKMFFAS